MRFRITGLLVSGAALAIAGTAAIGAELPAGVQSESQRAMPGAALYLKYCAECHDGSVAKAPSTTFLQLMPPDAVLAAQTTGVMQRESRKLSVEQKTQVAEYLFGKPMSEMKAPPPLPRCTGEAAKFDVNRGPRIQGWGFDLANSRRIPAEIAGLAPADIPKLKLKWALAYPGALRARSQPTFAMGALYVGSQDGTVYALDAASGCVRWTFRATAEVRTPIVIGPAGEGKSPGPPLAYFGDLIGRAYAVDALTGELKWKIKTDKHPSATITAAPVLYKDRLYVPVSSLEEASAPDPAYPCCSFRGSVVAIEARSGKVAWKSYTIPTEPKQVGRTKVGTPILAPSGAPIWAAMSVDTKRGLLYATTGNNYTAPTEDHSDGVVAFDLETGAQRWHWQSVAKDAWNVACMVGGDNCPEDNGPDYDIGAGSILVSTASGRDLLLIGRKDGMVMALDPDKHDKVLWQRKIGRGSIQGGVQWGMTAEPDRVYVPIADMADSSDGKVYTEPSKGGLYALDTATGESVWSTPADDRCNGEKACDPGILAAITSIPGAVFAGHMDGRIRAYDSATGKVTWEYDSRQEVVTLSGERARGGSVGGPGPVVHDGVLYVNSGYGLYFHLPGNVLLAFSVDGK
jgi:polyvinyl alcohol dehydrogenase (cytochrome)